jgi:regulator of sigma E protease
MCLTSAAVLWPAVFTPSLFDPPALLAVVAPELTTLELWQARAWIVVQIALGLGFVIFVHELGHFLVAKACGVKCDKFYIGFDIPLPKVFGWQIPSKLVHFQWGETEYGIGILPLGGYVKMLGQDDDPRNAEKEAERTKVLKEGTAAEGLAPGQTVEYVLDPRSFPAKSVPARMAIISAGVIMNLIFAVVLATIAYSYGVPETPAVIGRTLPYGPAWAANIPPGSKILQFGKSGQPYEHLAWDHVMREVVLNGFDQKLPILIRTPDGPPEGEWREVEPSDFLRKASVRAARRPTLGVQPQLTREISPIDAARAHLDVKTEPPLADRDLVVAVAGQPVEADHQLDELFVQHPSGPLTITVLRKLKPAEGSPASENPPPQRIDVVVPERRMRTLGLAMKMGPVIAVRDGSPAKDAGFQPDDQIEAIDGEPPGDPLSLGQRLTRETGKPVEFTVSRVDSQGHRIKKTLTVVPQLPRQLNDSYALGVAGIEPVGVAFRVLPEVAAVEPGSPAAAAGLQRGDIITEALFLPANEESGQREIAAASEESLEPMPLDDVLKTWPMVFSRMQVVLPDTKVKLTWQRGGKSHSQELLPVDAEKFFDESRNLVFYAPKNTHIAENFPEAVSLGFRETKDRVTEVLRVLVGLFSRKIPLSSLSGPAGIIYAAGTFADEGVPRTLIFLTLLSANLAVLNFLPIPALDGGHMLFLTAEWIRGKPVDERLQIRLTIAGILALLSLMVFATVMDIDRFFG